jgi:hypothetical protein
MRLQLEMRIHEDFWLGKLHPENTGLEKKA